MNRPAVSSAWILATTLLLVAALVPFDPAISRRAQALPDYVVLFNQRITDFGTFGWMIYGSGLIVIIALGESIRQTLNASSDSVAVMPPRKANRSESGDGRRPNSKAAKATALHVASPNTKAITPCFDGGICPGTPCRW